MAIELAEGRPPLFHLTRERAVDEVGRGGEVFQWARLNVDWCG